MKPITFSCSEVLDISAEEIVQQILDVENWSDFKGFGPLPGIEAAEFEVKTPEIVGSRIKVIDTDGSSHVEEIVEWQSDRRLKLYMKDFTPPLARLAIRFEETWDFEQCDSGTQVTRSFKLYAKTAFTRPLLWVISVFLKKAIARHLAQMRFGASA